MKNYTTPICLAICLDIRDVITLSGFGESMDWDTPTSKSTVEFPEE